MRVVVGQRLELERLLQELTGPGQIAEGVQRTGKTPPRRMKVRVVDGQRARKDLEHLGLQRAGTVQVAEPSIDETRTILYSLRPRLERNYSVRIQDAAIETALEMSPRYMRHLQLPDKVIGWLDTASVKAEISRRWEVTSNDVVNVISKVAQIPEDMVFREVSDRFRNMETRLGERVVAAVELTPGVALTEQALTAHCAANLAKYKVPERWVFVAGFARNSMNKIVRKDLPALFT